MRSAAYIDCAGRWPALLVRLLGGEWRRPRALAAEGSDAAGVWTWTLEDVVRHPDTPDIENLLSAAREVTFEAVDAAAMRHPVLREISGVLDESKLIQALQKSIASDVLYHLALVEAARLDALERGQKAAVLWIRRFFAWRAVAAYAASRGVKVRAYGASRPVVSMSSVASRVRTRLRDRLSVSKRKASTGGPAAPAPTYRPTEHPRITYWMAGRSVLLDPSARSDLFWLVDAPLDSRNVLLVFTREDVPAPTGAHSQLAKEGFQSIRMIPKASQDPGMPLWVSTPLRTVLRADLRRRVFRGLLRAVTVLRPWTLYIAAHAADFIDHYSLWRDFFESNRVVVDVTQYDFTRPFVARAAALADAGGISLSYQYSNLDVSTVEMSMSADVLMSFGPAYRWVYAENRSTLNTLVYSGYPTDNAFIDTRRSASAHRKVLAAAGASYVVAFFDENSSDQRMSLMKNSTALEEYSCLLDWLEDDESLGLILKPKAPGTLGARLGKALSERIERAVRGGRCLLLGHEEGRKSTLVYPCEAAQAADLAVGGLYGGTAVLESFLAGTRAVFLDAQHLHRNPAYANGGEGRIVFRSIEAIRRAAEAHRADPQSVPGFGDLSEWAADRVRLRDGRTAERISTYVKWLYDSLVAGATREETLESAARRYAERWGEGYVERMHRWGSED